MRQDFSSDIQKMIHAILIFLLSISDVHTQFYNISVGLLLYESANIMDITAFMQ